MPGMVRVPKIESFKQEQERFLKDFDRQVAVIEQRREQTKPEASSNKPKSR